jgi:anhydro-N-acetylmuramic acid kinase
MTAAPFTPLNVLGLMSGTSVDSIDAACVRIQMAADPLRLETFTLLGSTTLDMAPELQEALHTLMRAPTVSLKTLCELNFEMGRQFGIAAQQLIQQLAAEGIPVDLIASHGQTVYHIPPTLTQAGSTLQIGQPAVISEMTGIEVMADFRPADMAAGGHGAPLVPFADQLLFQDAHIARAVQNIGGIANLTALPAYSEASTACLAFDTGPGNMIIDALMKTFFNAPYDKEGAVAQQGRVHPEMLAAMLTHPFFNEPPPKSTGREQFGQPYVSQLLSNWQGKVSPEEMVATATHFTAITIANAYERFVLPVIPVQEVIAGGGGVFNRTLMDLLSDRLSNLGVILKRHEDFGVPDKFKEALAFALLGYARKMGLPANIPACTGAKHPAILGGSWQPFR